MEVDYFKTVFRYSLILILAMLVKASAMINLPFLTSVNLEFEEVEVTNDVLSYKKPEFNINTLNKFTNSYIEENNCESFEYNVYNINDSTVNIFLDCGNPTNIIYNYVSDKELTFKDIVKDTDAFTQSVTNLLNLKYPTFVTEEVNILEGTYNIKDNELIGYYNTEDFGEVTIKINNNEVKENLYYNMGYDDSYENETFTLDKDKKTIAFTFDDGPSTYDLEIIDTLVNAHASATFFVVGNRIRNYPESISKLLSSNMEIGNHTYDHKSLAKLSSTKIFEEINQTNQIFNEVTGSNIFMFRPSYGAVNKTVLLEAGMPCILWSVDTLDWKTRDSESVYNEIINNVKDGDIVLMHSLYKSTAEAVEKVLPELYKEGYQIVSVSKLFELKDKTLEIGKSYTSAR